MPSRARVAAKTNADLRSVLFDDQLGNVGVIAAGLFIWLTDFKWRMYSDPAISLVITCIIFSSALPLGACVPCGSGGLFQCGLNLVLCHTAKSASFILLQGVPSSIPLDRLRSAIAVIPGVLNVHGQWGLWMFSRRDLPSPVDKSL